VPVIVVAPHDALFDKTVSNMQEVAARGGRIVLLTDQRGAEKASLETMATLVLPDVAPEVAPIVYAIPVQLIAYHAALVRGTDVDQPRNLAKSVTVE
jgi:glucosamine--fructose-6-phosphate aminotransferase (isomerizing)